MRDKISIGRVALLHPLVRDIFTRFIDECESLNPEYTFRVTAGLRTFKDQAAIYAQGRTAPGKIVSNSKPGFSFHNYGLAVDLAKVDDKSIDWAFKMSELAPIARKYGITWGGSFKSIYDPPHFECNLGYSIHDLYAMYMAQGEPTYVKLDEKRVHLQGLA